MMSEARAMMGFFLLGRSADDTLSLLSQRTFGSRQDALAELSRITADASFDAWDDEVLLIDVDSGTPVLLVRPAASPVAETPAPAEPSSGMAESSAFAAIADEEPVIVPIVIPTAEPVTEPPAEPSSDVASVAAVEPAVIAEPVVPEEIAAPSLRDAIARTAEHMEASGIVAPDSIGPAVQPPVDVIEPMSISDFGPEELPIEPAMPDPVISQAESPAWPWDNPVAEAAQAEPEVEAAPVDPVTEAAPVELEATAAPAELDRAAALPVTDQVEAPYLLEGLEEPSFGDSASLIVGSADLEGPDLARPVILGAYDESPLDVIGTEARAEEPELEYAAIPAESAPVDSTAAAVEEVPDEIVAEADAPVLEDLGAFLPQTESDFVVLDSSPVEPAPAVAVAPEPAEDTLSLDSYTCDDCVYVETCPNKDQRLPKDCGSFQWT